MKATIESLKGQITHEHEANLKLDNYSRRSNLKFFGIEEKLRETDTDCEQAVRDFVSGKLGSDLNFPIERCHHIGAQPSGDTKRSRPIIVRISFFRDRENIWKQKGTLKGTNTFIKEDFPPEVEKRINKMMPSFLTTKRIKDLRAKLVIDRLYLNGTLYTVETIHQLPPDLQPENLAMRSDGQFTFFFKKESFLSNFYPSKFVKNGIMYNCKEQFVKSEIAYSKMRQHTHSSLRLKIQWSKREL